MASMRSLLLAATLAAVVSTAAPADDPPKRDKPQDRPQRSQEQPRAERPHDSAPQQHREMPAMRNEAPRQQPQERQQQQPPPQPRERQQSQPPALSQPRNDSQPQMNRIPRNDSPRNDSPRNDSPQPVQQQRNDFPRSNDNRMPRSNDRPSDFNRSNDNRSNDRPGYQPRDNGRPFSSAPNSVPRMDDRRGNPPSSYRTSAGHEVRYTPNGGRTIIYNNTTIVQSTTNNTRIIYQRPDRTVIVTNRSGHGYVQRPFVYHDQEFVHRTYYRQGVAYSRYYRPYSWFGVTFYTYTPVRYYPAPMYVWAYRPWPTRVSYRWGWYGSPWYGYYGGYFSPAPYYVSPTLWLVDYIIADQLAQAYNDRIAAQQAAYYGSGPTQLTPEVKDEIAREVQRQIDYERAQGQNPNYDPQAAGLPAMFNDRQAHVFVVSYTIDVVDQNNQECSVTRGDVLRLTHAPAPGAQAAQVEVVASKGQDCRAGSVVTVSLQDLQDTNNQMREAVNAGMGELQKNAGQGGLPPLPADARGAAQQASFADSAPPTDTQVAQELQQQVQEADRIEQQALSQAPQGQQQPQLIAPPQPAQPSPAPVRVTQGQSVNDVVTALGNPSQIVEVGKKLVYIYPNLKITFTNGRVTDVQ